MSKAGYIVQGKHLSELAAVGLPRAGASFRVEGASLRVGGASFRVGGASLRVGGASFRVEGAGMRVEGAGMRVTGVGSKKRTETRRKASVDYWSAVFDTALYRPRPRTIENSPGFQAWVNEQ
jgi:hypothetical protein